VGFDDTPSAALVTPALTSISQPLQEAAALLVEMLVARLAGRRPRQRSVLLAPSLVVRDSTGPPSGR
jgi:DNA-binding LacI/PurR family transcriptional regulator